MNPGASPRDPLARPWRPMGWASARNPWWITGCLLLVLWFLPIAYAAGAVDPAKPDQTTQRDIEPRVKAQEWRWNESAPWRTSPGRPPLFAQGESLAALGIDGAEMVPDWIARRSLVSSVAFSPDGRTLASASWDNSIRLWDLQGRALIATLEGHSDWVTSVAFSPDGRTLASASWDNSGRLSGRQGGSLTATPEAHTD